MSLNCLLRRASFFKSPQFNCSSKLLKHLHGRRSICSLGLGGYSEGPSLKSLSVVCNSTSHYYTELNRFTNRNKRQYVVSFNKYFSTQPSPKPSVSTVTGLADQVLRSSARDEKENEKKPDTSEQDKQQDQEKQVRAVKFTLIAFGGIFAGAVLYIFFVYGSPTLDRNGHALRDEFSDLAFLQQYYRRAMAELRGMVTMVTNPSRDKLLPDPVKPPYHQPPYTVLIELTGVLVHPDWTYKTGWRFKKRPGVDYFLNQLSGYFFEVVIYTSELGFTAFPIIEALDTQNAVHYRLFRDSTKYENGFHVKDLEKINRDHSKLITIDCNEKAVFQHRNNAIVLPRWKGNDDDRTLFDLAALLQTIGTSGIEDVRGVLEYYSKFEDPIAEFRKKQQELARKENDMKVEKSANASFSPATGWFGSMLRKN